MGHGENAKHRLEVTAAERTEPQDDATAPLKGSALSTTSDKGGQVAEHPPIREARPSAYLRSRGGR